MELDMKEYLERNKIFIAIIIAVLMISGFLCFFNISEVEARSGCCSWHGGVCGCRCCDGTPLSAKCAPYYPQCRSQPIPKYEPPAEKKYVAEIPKEDDSGGFIWWIIGIGAAAYIFYALGKRKREK